MSIGMVYFVDMSLGMVSLTVCRLGWYILSMSLGVDNVSIGMVYFVNVTWDDILKLGDDTCEALLGRSRYSSRKEIFPESSKFPLSKGNTCDYLSVVGPRGTSLFLTILRCMLSAFVHKNMRHSGTSLIHESSYYS